MKNDLSKYFSFLIVFSLTLSCGGGGESGEGSETSNPPGKPILTAPANNKACLTGNSISSNQSEVTFSWGASAKTSNYDLKVTNLDNNTIFTIKTGLSTTTTKVYLDKGLPYSWNITSKNISSSTKSDTWKFYLEGPGIVNYAPFPADLKEPNESIVNRKSDGKVTFTWEGSDPDSEDTLTYTLYVDKVDGKQTPPSPQSNLSVKTLDLALDGGETYFCRVKTSDGTNSSYSTIYSFLTK